MKRYTTPTIEVDIGTEVGNIEKLMLTFSAERNNESEIFTLTESDVYDTFETGWRFLLSESQTALLNEANLKNNNVYVQARVLYYSGKASTSNIIATIVTDILHEGLWDDEEPSPERKGIKKQYATPQQYGATGDGKTDDTDALQKCIDENKNIFIPDGTYNVTRQLVFSKNNYYVEMSRAAIIDGKEGVHESVIKVTGQYNEFKGGTIKYSGFSSLSAIFLIGKVNDAGETDFNSGFNTFMTNVTIRGNDKVSSGSGIHSGAGETRIHDCKIRGAYDGVFVDAPDMFIENTYCESNVRNGFRAERQGTIDANHIHSFDNGSHGFFLSGCALSNFTGCYADTNKGNGFYVMNINKPINFMGCLSHKNSGEFAYFVQNCQNVGMFGCKSIDNRGIYASYKLSQDSVVNAYSCYANDQAASINDGCTFNKMWCGGTIA